MREIRFRGKSKHTGHWLYGDLCRRCELAGEPHIGCVAVDPATVGQFTGLKDRNGIEIYEGDILSFPVKQKEPSRSFIVCFGEYTDYYTRFSQYGVYVMVSPMDDDGEKCISIIQSGAEDMVVIGNVHDTKEAV